MSDKPIERISFVEKHIGFLLPLLLFVVDYLAIITAEESAYWVRRFIIPHGSGLRLSWINFWIVFPFLYIIFIHAQNLSSRRFQFWRLVQHMFRACFYAACTVMVEVYIMQGTQIISRMFMLLFAIGCFFNLVVFRFIVKQFLHKYEILQTPVLIVGAGKTAEVLVKGLAGEEGLGYRVIGLLEDGEVNSDILMNYPVLGGFNDLEEVIKKTRVRHVIIAAPGIDPYLQGELVYRAQPLVENVGIVPNLSGMPMGGLEIESLFSEKLMFLRVKNNLARPLNIALKIFFDYLLTIVGTVCILPFLLWIAIWIYVDSPGPIIFKHTRIGKNGKAFDCYKFRTMCVDAEEKLADLLAKDPEAKEEWERDFKLKNDPRVTKSGAFLRRTSLDELPQIFNVLKGEMSLVGPRPVVQEELERYGAFVRDYLAVKPGITGYWQINGRSDTTYEERVLMDTWYVQNWSIWLDVMLLWRTFKVVLKQEGAY